MIKIAVTGMNGQIGKCLQASAKNHPSISFHFFNKEQWDITDVDKCRDNLDNSFDILINTAAYTSVDLAEKESDLCDRINVDGIINLVEACNESNVHLIHFSSDYVYNNNHFRPLKEEDDCFPVGVYAQSKLKADEYIMANSGSSTIIRSSWIYSAYGHNFVKTMLNLSKSKPALKVVQDQWGCPTSAHDLAEMLCTILTSDQLSKGSNHIYNFTQKGLTNWFEVALEVMKYTNAQTCVTPITTSMYPTTAQRPFNSILDCDLFDRSIKYPRRYWKESLRSCLDQLNV